MRGSVAFKGGLLLGIPAGMMLGVSLTPSPPPPPPEPEVRVVESPPEIITKEVIKEVEVKQDLPDSCFMAKRSSRALTNKMADYLRLYKESLDYLNYLDMRSLSDPNAAHDTEDGMNKRAQRLDTILQDVLYSNSYLQRDWSSCKDDIKEQE